MSLHSKRSYLTVLVSGLVFALGLGISGMTKQTKVIGFLDLSGQWDPSLAFVMIGAIAVHFVASRLIRKRPKPIFGEQFHLPTAQDLDAKLLAGAALFGIGWGLGGFCPGPGLVSVVSGAKAPLVFVGAMTFGMVVQHFAFAPRAKVPGEVRIPSPLP
jgi:hypothetical protein